MASGLDDHSDYESEERIELDVDLDLANIHVGCFTIDITSDPELTIGEIRNELAEILGVSVENLFLSYNNSRLQNAIVVKEFLDDIKLLGLEHRLTIELNDVAEEIAAKCLEPKVYEALEIKEAQSVILMDLNPHREVELTVFITNFNAYMLTTFHF